MINAKRINYKSDFDFILRLLACAADGSQELREVGWPNYDWVARIYTTNKANAYTVSCIDGVCTNCFEDKGKIHVVINGHRMGIGQLNIEFHSILPNGIYPDGIQTEVSPQSLGVELVDGRGDCGAIFEVDLMLPIVGVGSVGKTLSATMPLQGVARRRHIPLGAEPGIVYRCYGRNEIKLGSRSTLAGLTEKTFDLSGIYIGTQSSHVPLSKAITACYATLSGAGVEGLGFSTDEGSDSLTVTLPADCRELYAVVPGAGTESHVVVQRDKNGGRIFTFMDCYQEQDVTVVAPDFRRARPLTVTSKLCLEWTRGVRVQIWGYSRKTTKWAWRNCHRGKSLLGKRMHYIRYMHKTTGGYRSQWIYCRHAQGQLTQLN